MAYRSPVNVSINAARCASSSGPGSMTARLLVADDVAVRAVEGEGARIVDGQPPNIRRDLHRLAVKEGVKPRSNSSDMASLH